MYRVLGEKAGSKKQRQPVIAADSAQSRTYIKQLIGLSAGEVAGLDGGFNAVYLDDTPLHDENGNPNFENVTMEVRNGTNDQDYIQGFPEISSEIGVQVELKSSTPWVRAISNLQLDAVTIRFRWGALREQNAENGDVNGLKIEYAIDVQTDGGTWKQVIKTDISDKTSANYERSHRVELPKADRGWQVRVRRITPNSTSEFVSDKMYVQAITETIDAKLAYPNVALLFLQYDAETFGGNVAKVAVRMKGMLMQVPSNYNPITRKYVGMWDGLFKEAYTNNPAYAFYHVCLDKINGLGNRISSAMIDKWSIYALGQYSDQLVPDGKGGEEPRYTLNAYIQAEEDAWTTLQKITSVFNGFVFWDGTKIQLSADVPQDTVYTYTMANVIDGVFEYTGIANKDRHTVFVANWDNPANRFKTEQTVVRDERQIAQHGIKKLELNLWGCTSEGQAQRAAQRAMLSEKYETRTVTFKVGFDALVRGKTKMPQVGKVIEIADPMFAGRANGGRISAVSADRKRITIDRDDVVCRAGDRLVVNGEDGQAQARVVQSISGRVITVVSAFDSVAAENVWVVDASDLATMKFRVISITQNDVHQFTVNGLQYNPAKYDAIDHGAFIDDRPTTIINPNTQKPVQEVFVEAESMVQQGLSIATMVIHWEQVEAAVKYQVEWRKDNGSWIKMPLTGNNTVDIQGIYSGMYEARVTAISAFDISSLPTYSRLTELKGKQGLPPKLAFIRATGVLFGMQVDWGFPTVGALDTAYTEIEVSPDGQSNIAMLGQFGYPTNTHTIQGLQANLTQFYRGRLVDRIGNKGLWSEWVSGTTTANADEILDLLDGQITDSQLDKDLLEKIDKITDLNVDLEDIIQAIENVEDGLMQEIQHRKDGDENTLNMLEIYKISNDQSVASAFEKIDLVEQENEVLATKINGVYARVSPVTADSTELTADSTSTEASAWDLYSAQIEGDSANAEAIRQVAAQSNENAAVFREEIRAQANATNALSQRTDTLQTTVGDHTASIQRQDQSIDGLKLQSTLKLDSNGYVGGVAVSNDGNTVDFIIRADKFAIAAPAGRGNASKYAFVYQASATTLPNGTVIPAGLYLADAVIGRINADKIWVNELSAISGSFGTLKAKSANIDVGAIKTAHIGDAQVNTLQVAGGAVSANVMYVAASTYTIPTFDTWFTIAQANMNAAGGNVIAWFSFSDLSVSGRWTTSRNAYVLIRIRRGNTVLESIRFNVEHLGRASVVTDGDHRVSVVVNYSQGQQGVSQLDPSINLNNIVMLPIMDSPPSGSNTYYVDINVVGFGSGPNAKITNRKLILQGAKR